MRVVGIDVAGDEVRVARGSLGLGGARLDGVERWTGAAGDAALARVARERPAVVLAAVPAQLCAHRIVVLPFRDRDRLERAAPMELLGRLASTPDDTVVATLPLGPAEGGTAVLAVAVRRVDLDAHLAPLRRAGLAPARVDLAPLAALGLLHVPHRTGRAAAPGAPAALLLADGARSALVVTAGGVPRGLRALGADAADPAALAAEVRWTLAALGGAARIAVVGPHAAKALDAVRAAVDVPAEAEAAAADADCRSAGAVAAGLVLDAARRPALALGGTAGRLARRAWRRPAALAAAVIAAAVLDLAVVRHGLQREEAMLARTIADTAAAARPGLSPEAALAALEQAAADGASGLRPDAVLAVLRELSERIPPALGVDLDELVIEPGAVLLHGRCTSFDAVDGLRRALGASPALADVAADETRTTVDGGAVEFRLRARRRLAETNA